MPKIESEKLPLLQPQTMLSIDPVLSLSLSMLCSLISGICTMSFFVKYENAFLKSLFVISLSVYQIAIFFVHSGMTNSL